VLLQLERERERVNADDAIPDSQPLGEDSDYGSPVQVRSTADIVNDNSLNSARDTSDESARRRDKRPVSDASSPSQPAAKRARDHAAALEPEYVITVSNINRRKERERRRRLESRLSEVFVTEEEDNMQDAYIRENGRKLSWLAK
jgi:hypothetical protein